MSLTIDDALGNDASLNVPADKGFSLDTASFMLKLFLFLKNSVFYNFFIYSIKKF